jgi:hypothetical protein
MKKCCDNCRHTGVSIYESPCECCNLLQNWEPFRRYDRFMADMTIEKAAKLQIRCGACFYYDSQERVYDTKDQAIQAQIKYLEEAEDK